ncbi:hypothetical protein ACFFX0_01685 [Citricoccus parietis]|uniref:Uncharacterized protein n=1 Tax=Citricoccus parietis TaxID=592307 RepID=A0ABV5FTG1_9MICC
MPVAPSTRAGPGHRGPSPPPTRCAGIARPGPSGCTQFHGPWFQTYVPPSAVRYVFPNDPTGG